VATTLTASERRPRRAAPLAPEERRAAVVAAVQPLLMERGRSATSKELARAAGVSEGTIFKVFADKEDLWAAVMARVVDPAPVEHAIAALDPSLGFEERLALAAAHMQGRLVAIWSLLSQLGPVGLDTRARRIPDSTALRVLFVAEAARLRVPPNAAARLFQSLVLALSHPMLNDPPPDPAELVDVFLHGVGARS
jgi:AcrR family transcriptional regulator